MYFTKGRMIDIDQRHYFRNTVFASLKWKHDPKPSLSHLERATAFLFSTYLATVGGLDKSNPKVKNILKGSFS